MSAPLVMTFIGPDRPGLVNAIAAKVAAQGGAWLESRLARLAGQFAGLVRIEIDETRIAALTADLRELEAEGLRITVERGLAESDEAPVRTLRLELLGLDRPGIVREVSQTLSALGVNIEEFESGLTPAPFTGAPMFKAVAKLAAPAGLADEEMRRTLERLAAEMMVDISVRDAGADAAG